MAAPRLVKSLSDIEPVVNASIQGEGESYITSPARSIFDSRQGIAKRAKSLSREIIPKIVGLKNFASSGRGHWEVIQDPAACSEELEGDEHFKIYELLQCIGIGTYGKVMLARSSVSGKLYACKVIDKVKVLKALWWRLSGIVKEEAGEDRDLRNKVSKMVEKEALILQSLQCSHENINKMVDIIHADDSMTSYFMFELCEYGAILELTLGKSSIMYSESLVRVYSLDILDGLLFLHSRYIVHCDIKPENILLKASNCKLDKYGIDRSRTGIAQITDFGNSLLFTPSTFNIPRKICVWRLSPAFAPPELFLSGAAMHRAPPIDVWALGVTMYCLAHGKLPWAGNSSMGLYHDIINTNIKISPRLSYAFADILSEIIRCDPLSRPSLSQVKSHPWLECRQK